MGSEGVGTRSEWSREVVARSGRAHVASCAAWRLRRRCGRAAELPGPSTAAGGEAGSVAEPAALSDGADEEALRLLEDS